MSSDPSLQDTKGLPEIGHESLVVAREVEDAPEETESRRHARESVKQTPQAREEIVLSLEDLEHELEEGEISQDDHDALVQYYQDLLDNTPIVEATRDTQSAKVAKDAQSSNTERTHKRVLLKRIGVIFILIGIASVSFLLVDHHISSRLPGQSASGSIDLSSKQKLTQALSQAKDLEVSGNFSQALGVYNQVLSKYPDQPEALAYSGWIIALAESHEKSASKAGQLLTQARDRETAAVDFSPNYPDARYFLGAILFEDYNQVSTAIIQFNKFLDLGPSESFLTSVAPIIDAAYKKAGLARPSQMAGIHH